MKQLKSSLFKLRKPIPKRVCFEAKCYGENRELKNVFLKGMSHYFPIWSAARRRSPAILKHAIQTVDLWQYTAWQWTCLHEFLPMKFLCAPDFNDPVSVSFAESKCRCFTPYRVARNCRRDLPIFWLTSVHKMSFIRYDRNILCALATDFVV